MKISDLKAKRSDLVEKLKSIPLAAAAANRSTLSDEETKRCDEIEAEIRGIDETIKRLEAIHRTAQEQVAAEANGADSTTEQRDANGNAIKPNPDTRNAPRLDVMPNGEKPFRSLGEQLQAIAQVTRGHGENLTELRNRLNVCVRAALGQNEAVPAEGGFLLFPEFAAGIQKRTFEVGQLSSQVDWIPLTQGNQLVINALKDDSRATGSRYGGIRIYMGNEADQATKSKVDLREIKVDLKKMIGLYYATEEILEDAPALATLISNGFSDESAFKLDDMIIRGDGNMELKGYLNSGSKVKQTKEGGQAAGTIVFQNIIKMYSRSTLGPKAGWYANRETLPQLAQMNLAVGTGGSAVWLPAGGLSGKPYNTLLGLPLYFIEQCEALGTEGDIMLLDPSDYLGVKKGGLRTDMSIHVQFLTGENTFRVMQRVGGQPWSDKPITPYKGSNTLSACVTLENR